MRKTVFIAGAGPAGLTAALELARRTQCKVIVVDSDEQVGGISKTVCYRGNRMDLGGHRFFSKSDWVMRWWQEILPIAADASSSPALNITYQNRHHQFAPLETAPQTGDRCMLLRPRLSRILYRRKFYDYPLKLNLATVRNLGLTSMAAIATSYAAAKVSPRSPERSLEDFFINRFGMTLYQTFFRDYTEKVWGVSCREIAAEWGAQRIKGLSITKALLHSLKSLLGAQRDLGQKGTETSLIEQFLYPKFGPGQMWEEVARLASAAGVDIHMRTRVVGLRHSANRITAVEILDLATQEARLVPCDDFISTMPLAQLVDQLQPADAQLRSVAANLPYRDFMTAGLILKRMKPVRGAAATHNGMPPDNWIYVQEPDVKLGRLQIFNNWSPAMVANAQTISLGLEYFCAEGDALWAQKDSDFLQFASRELEQIGLASEADVLDGTVVRVRKAYPAYFGEYRSIAGVRAYLDGFENLYPVGRNGMHRYNNQDHSMLAAKAAVDSIVGEADKKAIWSINAEDDYHEHRANQPEKIAA